MPVFFGRYSLLLSLIALAVLIGRGSLQSAPPQISEDRDLKEIDLTKWDCLNQLEGTAKTPDGLERNRLKNRSAPDGPLPKTEETDTIGFLKRVEDFDAQTRYQRRKDLTPAQKQQLDALEKQVIQLTGYLVLAYCGPPEATNCGNIDFHDWHLELFEKPSDHSPQPGDPTPIVCEITPRTQNAIFHDNVRIQELTAFFRRPDLTTEPTSHPAQKIRVTGFLMWDDEHNGKADAGKSIERIAPNKYHQPWRSTAWEIHPVFKVERVEGAATPSALYFPTKSPDFSDRFDSLLIGRLTAADCWQFISGAHRSHDAR